MNARAALRTVLLAALALVAAASPAMARSKGQIIASLRARYPALKALVTRGMVGETWTGYPEAVNPQYLNQQVNDRGRVITVQRLLQEEGFDRRELYQIIAREQNTSEKLVAEHNGKRKLQTLASGEYYKLRDGRWIRKK